MKELEWIKELVETEQKMEESGIIDVSPTFDQDKNLEAESILFLNRLKDLFIDHTAIYNKMRGASIGGVKIYGISKTKADFMLFRNGFKLFFSLRRPGIIAAKIHYHGADILTAQTEALDSMGQEDLIEARLGAFNEVIWTHQEQSVNLEYLGRFYFSRFVKESTK
jgi:hypothetical protein